MTQRKVQQVLRRVADATPSGKLPSERESEALRLATAVGGVVGKMAGVFANQGPHAVTREAGPREGSPRSSVGAMRRQHVVPQENGWAVKAEGDNRASAVFATRDEAISHAIKLGSEAREVIVHGKLGMTRTESPREE